MDLKVLGLGLDFEGNPLFEAKDGIQFADSLIASMNRNIQSLRGLSLTRSTGTVFREELEREIVDLGDPKSAGWTYLINANDPQREEIESKISELARHRGMEESAKPLLYNDEPPEKWFDWLTDNYFALELDFGKLPK